MSSSYHGLSQSEIDRIEWRLLAAAAVAAFGFGWLGFYQYASPHGSASIWSSAYHSLQLIILHTPHLEGSIPFSLEIGRWLGAVVFFWAALKLVFLVARRDWRNLSLLWKKGHVVICGLGRLGLPLMIEAQKLGLKPVAIEKDPDLEGVREAMRNRVPVIIGDASQEATLLRAKVQRARQVFAVCTDDHVNMSVAAHARQLKLQFPEGPKLECWLFLANPKLRAALQRHDVFHQQGLHYSVNVRGLDPYAVRARIAFENLPLTHLSLPYGSDKRPKLVLVGFGEMGQSLALHAARNAHFASGGMLEITVVDEKAVELVRSFKARFPNMDKVAEIIEIAGTFEDVKVRGRVLEICKAAEDAQELLACAVCHDGEGLHNAALALDLVHELPGRQAPVLLYLETRLGFAQLMPLRGPRLTDHRLQPFGMMEEIWTLGTLRDERQDKLARQFHQAYLDSLKESPETAEGGALRPAQKPWEDLDETYRAASRGVADHLRIKLHAVGFEMKPLSRGRKGAIPQLGAPQIELLGRMEHARWCAERWLGGWSYGPERNDVMIRHPDLVPWEELKDHERKIDFYLMGRICAALEGVGYGVFPLSQK